MCRLGENVECNQCAYDARRGDGAYARADDRGRISMEGLRRTGGFGKVEGHDVDDGEQHLVSGR